MTEQQRDTLDLLQSKLDDLEWEKDDYDSDDLVVAGNDSDGPRVGYLNTDGIVTWLC